MTTAAVKLRACPKCTTGAIFQNHDDKEFFCINCGLRVPFGRKFSTPKRMCDGSGLMPIQGSQRSGQGGLTGRCSLCGLIVQLIVNRGMCITHPPRLGDGRKHRGLKGVLN